MKRRFALYGFGFALGLLIVFFFLGGKKASCNWMPNERILKVIRQKQVLLSQQVKAEMPELGVDSIRVMKMLEVGDVDFSKSQVKNDPCRNYWIEDEEGSDVLIITVELCDGIATVKTIQRK